MADAQQLAEQFKAATHKSVENYIEAGRVIIRAENTLGLRGDAWDIWLRDGCETSKGYASKLKRIAGNPIVVSHAKRLPRDVESLYALARVPADALQDELSGDTVVRPQMNRAEAKDVARRLLGEPVRQSQRVSVDDLKHQLTVAEKRTDALEADFDGAVAREVEAALTGEVEQEDPLKFVPAVFEKDVKKYTRKGQRPKLKEAYEEYRSAFWKLQRLLTDAQQNREEGE